MFKMADLEPEEDALPMVWRGGAEEKQKEICDRNLGGTVSLLKSGGCVGRIV